ncbi:hypothetical protein [Streptomyces clavuligerus]|uniref:hypothetical protein n=1 Tax=Streptomyces clavuligerus TaxID=1901 RepID=UPI0013C50FBC|nr:hypothetical protein [Streptomyces clavuligerus]
MDGDRAGVKEEDGKKTVTVQLGEGEGTPITDHESLSGFSYKNGHFDKPGGKILAKTRQQALAPRNRQEGPGPGAR